MIVSLLRFFKFGSIIWMTGVNVHLEIIFKKHSNCQSELGRVDRYFDCKTE